MSIDESRHRSLLNQLHLELTQPRYSQNLKLHSELDANLAQYENKKPYTPKDLEQVATTINRLQSDPDNPKHEWVMQKQVRRNAALEHRSPQAMEKRLAMIKAAMQALLKSVTAEMNNSSFFRQGQEDKAHVEKVMQNLKKSLQAPYEQTLAKKSSKRLDRGIHNYYLKTSLPYSRDLIENHEAETYNKQRSEALKEALKHRRPSSQDYLLDKPTIGAPLRNTEDSKAITQEQMQKLIDTTQERLFDLLAQEMLTIADNFWINREGGIFAWSSPTFEKRMTSVASGIVALEYLKSSAIMTERLRNHLIAQELAKQIPRQPPQTTSPLTQRNHEQYIEEIMHLSLATGASLLTGNPSFIVKQGVDTCATLCHKAVDPNQESQELNLLASSIKTVGQTMLLGGKLITIPLELFKATVIKGAVAYFFSQTAPDKVSREFQDVTSGLVQATLTGNESHLVSSGLFYTTAQLDNYGQRKAQELNQAGYTQTATWTSRCSRVLRTNATVNALATTTLLENKPKPQTRPQRQVSKKSRLAIEKRKIQRIGQELSEEDIQKLEEMGKLPPTVEPDLSLHLENLIAPPQPPNRDLYFKHTNGLYRVYDQNTGQEISSFHNRDKAECWISRIKEMDICSSTYETLLRALQILAVNDDIPLEQINIIKPHNINISGTQDSGKVTVDGSSENGMRVKHDKTGEGQAFEFSCRIFQDTTTRMVNHIHAVANTLGININEHPELRDLEAFLETHKFERVPKTNHHKDTGFFSIISRKIDRLLSWCDENGIELNINLSKTISLYPEPKSPNLEQTANHLQQQQAELAELERQQTPEQPQIATNPTTQPIAAPKKEEPQQKDHLPIHDYEYGELAQSNIPEWIRYGVSPDQSSLDPRERIESNHAQLAALTTSIGKFIGGLWDTIRNWGSASHPTHPSATQQMEDLAERAVPYDRTQPGYYMLQKTSDILVDTLGFLGLGSMGANIGRGGINVDRVRQINPGRFEAPTQIAARNISQEASLLERMNQPAYRSGIAQDGRAINATRGINRSLNHEYITFVENGQTKAISFADMNHAGTFPDRGGLTKAGRAFEKHGQRPDTVFPRPKGTVHEKNMEGQRILDEILNHPDKRILIESHLNFGEVIDIWHPKGYGARFTKDGKEMIGFLEPLK